MPSNHSTVNTVQVWLKSKITILQEYIVVLEPSVRASLVFIFHRAVEKLMTDYKYFRLSVGHKKLIILTFLSMAE